MRRRLLAPAFAVLCTAGACGEATSPAREAAMLEPCRVGPHGDARCGVVKVPEDPAAPAGRQIELRVVVLPALSRAPAPDPLFILAGGPGQAASEVGPMMAPLVREVRRERDVVLVDQRGTGSSSPLDCQAEDSGSLAEAFRAEMDLDLLDECLASYEADPRLFTTPIAMDDLDLVRARLGYEQINLYGASYGTRAALVYGRRHPEHTRSLVLDGVAPQQMHLPASFPADGQRSLALVFEACAEDPACVAAFPDLEGTLADLLDRLEATPIRVSLAHPRTGEIEQVEVHPQAVSSVLRGALYAPETAALVPLTIARAAEGDYRPLAALAAASGGTAETMSLGMFLSVVCAEDVPFIDGTEGDGARGRSLVDPDMVETLTQACSRWPRGELPEGYHAPFDMQIPTLLLSGVLDPATPPRWAEQVAEGLPVSRHVVVPGTGHGTWLRGCVPRLIGEFLETPDPGALDPSCTEHLRAFPPFVDASGPSLGLPPEEVER